MMIVKHIRLHKRDSAFVYAIFESLEGMVSYSTVGGEASELHRDLRLCIAPSFRADVEQVLEGLRKKFPIVEL